MINPENHIKKKKKKVLHSAAEIMMQVRTSENAGKGDKKEREK
uniref:Uncharacterized protein n=1 Tax=Rhizophora mucronata TaxID=61149 RepID=A0A2P2PH11_RHIMU